MRRTCSSLSITHGPAIKASGAPAPKLTPGATSIPCGVLDISQQRPGQPPLAILVSGPDKGAKQRVRLKRLRFELGMELATQIPGMVADLADLDIGVIRCLAGNPQPGGGQDLLVFTVEFVAMPVALADLGSSVGFMRETALLQNAGPGSQTHRAAQLVDALELAQLINHAVRRPEIEFARVGPLQAAHVARVLDHHGLHPEADTEVGNLVLARVADGVDHALNAALPEAAGNQDRVVVVQLPLPIFSIDALGLYPVDLHAQIVR